jgi:uncharacterized protein
MANQYRPTAAMRSAAVSVCVEGELAASVRGGLPLSAAQVGSLHALLRDAVGDVFEGHGGLPGLEWAGRIRGQLLESVRAVGVQPVEELVADSMPQMAGANAYSIDNYILAADASIDAAQMLLEQTKDTDPVSAQAYALLVAADAALDPVIEALGLSDPDDAENDVEARAKPADVHTGVSVSWQSKDGRSVGKIEKVAFDGILESSEGFQLKATPAAPLCLVRVFDAQGDGFTETDRTVVQPASILHVIADLVVARAADVVDVEERKSVMASAERFTVDTEVRAATAEDGVLRIAGYAAKFGQESTGLSFREVIAPGAFTRTLQSGEPVFLLVNHDTDQLPLASTQGGTLQLREDEVGLFIEATLDPVNPRAAELYSALSRMDVDKMSFAFTVAPDGQTREGGLRTLTDVTLYEVSVVLYPAYASTEVSARAAEDDLVLRQRWLAAQQQQLHI